MVRAPQYVRASFAEAFQWLRRVSLRTWMVIFLGPAFAFLVVNSGRAPAPVAWYAAILLAIWIVALVIADARRTPFGSWATKAVIAWAIAVIAVSIGATSKVAQHDELLLTEVAMEKVQRGDDPYGADYRGTLVDRWTGHSQRLSYVNGVYPGWDHYVYFPGFLVLGYPVYAVVHGITGMYDQRIVHVLAYAALVAGAWLSLRRSPRREALTLIVALNPFLMNVAYGLNDLVPIALLALAGFSLAGKKPIAAAVWYGLALATKQTTALTIPFMLPMLVRTARQAQTQPTRVLAVAAVTAAIVVVPFFVWSPSRFFDDTVRFFFSAAAYPIHGDGLSGLFARIGLVTEGQYYPFWIFQIAATVPLLAYFVRKTLRSHDLGVPFFASAVTIGVLWFFSRYFLTSHAHGIILLLILSFVISESQRSIAT